MSDPTRKRLLELDKRGKPVHAYTKSEKTDISKTFARIRRQLKEAAEAQPVNVKQLKKRSA